MKAKFYTQHTRKCWLCFPFVILLLLVVAACGTSTSAPPSTQTQAKASQATTAVAPGKVVEISIIEQNERYSFSPATITISKGTEVKWINNTDAPHTASSYDNMFKSSNTLTEKQSYNLIFPTAGTYKFHCSIHTYMQGTIVVTA